MDSFDAPSLELGAYLDAVRRWQAGSVTLEAGEDASMAQLLLLRAASLLDLPVTTAWLEGGRELLWCRIVRPSRTAVGWRGRLLTRWNAGTR